MKHDEMMATFASKTAAAYGIPIERIYSRLRWDRLCQARMIAIYLSRMAGFSSTEIGRHFHRDHSTVLNAQKVVARRIASSDQIRELVESIARQSEALNAA